jgi:dihydroxyacetone kinase
MGADLPTWFFYSIWSNALAAGFTNVPTADAACWARALSHALATLYKYTAARRPSRTLIDPLSAFTDHFSASKGADLAGAVAAAVEAAEETKKVRATAGRAAYVGQGTLREANVPDPGAWGVVKILEGIQRVIEGQK